MELTEIEKKVIKAIESAKFRSFKCENLRVWIERKKIQLTSEGYCDQNYLWRVLKNLVDYGYLRIVSPPKSQKKRYEVIM